MNDNKFRYVEIVTGNVKNRGNVVELKCPYENVDYFSKPNKTDCFISAFIHTIDYHNYSDAKGGKTGYRGEVFVPLLFWDFDNTDLNKSRIDAIELVESLMAYRKESIRMWFSGGKGFHCSYYSQDLYQQTDYGNFNNLVKNICSYFAGKLKTFDTKIYDKTRIFRVPNSKHPDTGLYKIELTYEELKKCSIDEIRQMAQTQRKINFEPFRGSDPDFLEIINQKFDSPSTVKTNNFSYDELLQGIQHGFTEGNRNTGYASIAGLLHRRNIDSTFINAILGGINLRSGNPLAESEINTIVNSICRYDVDPQYQDVKSEDIVTFKQAGEKWEKMIKSSGEFSLGPRFSHINETLSSTLTGDVIGIVANSGVGKSSILLEFGNNFAKTKGGYSLFCSLEMASHSCYFRASTMSHTPDENGEISSKIVAKDLLNDQSFRDSVEREWENTLIADKGSLSINQIEELFHKAQEMANNRITSLSIDYLQYVEGMSDISRSLLISRSIKDLAKKLNTVVFLAVQANKSLVDSYTEPNDQNIEGAKALLQMMDYQMWLWRSRDDSKRLHCKFGKTRWGKNDEKFDLVRNGLRYHSDSYLMDRPSCGI